MSYDAYRDAYCEVLYIIDNMQIENKRKISKKFINFLEKNKNENYKYNNISLQNPNTLKKETKIILSLIYRSYFCSKEEKIKMDKDDKEAIDKIYSYDYIFRKNKEFDSSKDNAQQNDVSLAKISNFRKFINTIKEKIKVLLKK